MTLNGTTYDYIVPVDLEVDPETLSATGQLTIRHDDFGLIPYSAAAGLLRVADDIDIRFSLSAHREILSET